MSVLRFINGRNRTLPQLKGTILYIFNPEKVQHNCRGGTGVLCDEAFDDMRIIKIIHDKVGGRQYIHFVLSFDQEVNYRIAYDVSEDVLAYFEDRYQVVFALHENTDNVHTHFILNTVGADGRKFRQSKREMLVFREFVNEILEGYDLKPIGKIDMVPTDEYPELAQLLDTLIVNEMEWYEVMDEFYDVYPTDEEDEAYSGQEHFQEAYVPIWFDGQKPRVPIWFDKNHEEKNLGKKLIEFFD